MTKAGEFLAKYRYLVEDAEAGLPTIRIVLTAQDGSAYQRLDEGKWIDGRFPNNIRLDQPTHMQGAGQTHGHVYGRNGQELVVVNLDGTGSHGSKGRLHADDAAALKARGFVIRDDRMVEWYVALNPGGLELLLG